MIKLIIDYLLQYVEIDWISNPLKICLQICNLPITHVLNLSLVQFRLFLLFLPNKWVAYHVYLHVACKRVSLRLLVYKHFLLYLLTNNSKFLGAHGIRFNEMEFICNFDKNF